MPLHPRIAAALKAAEKFPAMETMAVPDARTWLKSAYLPKGDPVAVGSVASRTIPGPHGEIPLRIYRPEGDGPFPMLVFFHGSGFVALDLDTHDDFCRRLCAGAGYLVVSVDYRLAPEHKFPMPLNDCVAATVWAASHAAELHATDRLVLAGDSAGGCLTAATAAILTDQGAPHLHGQVLIYPVTNYPDPLPNSFIEFASGFGLSSDGMRWFWDHYLRDRTDGNDPRASPLRRASFAGLPPAFIATAEYDVLRDEGEAYAARLREAGVAVELERVAELNHGFLKWSHDIPAVADVITRACAWLVARG